MKDKEIKRIYIKKLTEIEKYNEYYFDKNNSLISDAEYDLKKKEILNLEKKYKFLNNKNSPSKTIGFKPSKNFKKVKHRYQCFPYLMHLMRMI